MEQPNLLEEMLYFKSDDVDGRNNAFKAITRVEKSHHLPVCLNPSMCCSASLNP
jgi:DNA-directed RNA polymerase beta subunit